MKTEPNWKIKPKHYDSFAGGNTYGLDENNTLWLVAYVTQSWVDFLVDFDGNAEGAKVGDFDGCQVGDVWDADNILIAVDEAELEAAALMAQAKQEFGF
jgi:hypothetical protein